MRSLLRCTTLPPTTPALPPIPIHIHIFLQLYSSSSSSSWTWACSKRRTGAISCFPSHGNGNIGHVYDKKKTGTVGLIPARDRVIGFGKHRGKMLGTLPPEYLRWVSKNLRAGDSLEWAQLADQVLEDEVYRDRMEWEQARRLLSGEVAWRSDEEGGVARELERMSEGFGWDNDDKVGWSKVDFGLLGTSKGGRIPRRRRRRRIDDDDDEKRAIVKEKDKKGMDLIRRSGEESRSSSSSVRGRRRERMRSKRGQAVETDMNSSSGRTTGFTMRGVDDVNDEDKDEERKRHMDDDDDGRRRGNGPLFPGRQSLLRRVELQMNRRRRNYIK